MAGCSAAHKPLPHHVRRRAEIKGESSRQIKFETILIMFVQPFVFATKEAGHHDGQLRSDSDWLAGNRQDVGEFRLKQRENSCSLG